ncbi:hypothetical protein Barb7_00716 [Bacteroidales bacterium Barb7]|nr:hypothetical protein Barb7_00716 [Bacteroidales bacterium Barb7]
MVSGRQRYLCKQCGYHYTAVRKSDVKPAEVRHMALEMYLEGGVPGCRSFVKNQLRHSLFVGKGMGSKSKSASEDIGG